MSPGNHCQLPNRIWQIIADNNCHIGPGKDISSIKSSTTRYIQLIHISKLSPDFFIFLNHQLECVIFEHNYLSLVCHLDLHKFLLRLTVL